MPTQRFDEDFRRRQRHQPSFCEENVWWLLQAPELPETGAALFITNPGRTVAMWGQRAATRDPIVWDYHVVALLPRAGLVLDLDDQQRFAWPLHDWLAHAFRDEVEAEFQPQFRLIEAGEFRRVFSSDRSHMRDAEGRPLQPFPAWPAPFAPERGMNLPRFLDLDDPIAGVVLDREGLVRLAAR